ncbi:catalase [Amphritea opalescens]|uniref:Catalase n=1 Tax=Amphritea opalescens TaxID=2490544 RepID=A0A430KNX8_9GAMM|nr:putative metalloprotease CJM1_0395 family protein [Amphritea opalescens]RTE65166.1 catalase [Amphritea opalescens]
MQVSLATGSHALNTNEPLNTLGRNSSAADRALSSSSSIPADTLPTSPSTIPTTPPVQPSSDTASADTNPNNKDPSLGSDAKHASTNNAEIEAESQQVAELATRDAEVRQHELTHAAAGGQYAGAPTFEYQRGPDGRLYAVGGEVSIDTSSVPDDPQATLEKAEVIMRAALAVAEPSSQDRSVAAQAAAMASEARAELARQNQEPDDNSANQIETQQLSDEQRAEELEKQKAELEEQAQDQAEQRNEYNQQLAEVNLKLAEVHQKLIDAGVFKKLFNEGFVFDERV